MNHSLLGESAALATAFCFALTALAFESAGRRVGSLPVNLIRLLLGFGFLVLVVVFRGRPPLPLDASPETWLLVGLSGLVGFAFGDLCLFRAFVLIGSRLSMLVMALVPPMAAILGWIALGEALSVREWLGMTMTVGGVTWVVRERVPDDVEGARAPSRRGVLLAVGGALGQAVGLVLAKQGLNDYDAFAGTQIRVLAGIAGFIGIFTVTGLWPRFIDAVRHPQAMSRTAVGAFFGPFLGVSLSLVALQHTMTGVAATIMSTTPVIILPISYWWKKERVTSRAFLGALVAIGGTALLFL